MKVVSADTLADALAALGDATEDSRVLAGGTDLMVEMESGRTLPDLVVDVWKLDWLRGIRETDAGLEIGALATCTDLLRSEAVRKHADILAEAASWVGAVQIRNRATIGGNLGTASPAADLNPVLFALDARVRLVSRRGSRELPVEAFVTGYRRTERALDELIESVVIPFRSVHERRVFRKVGTRKAQSIAKVVVALCVEIRHGTVRSIRASAGSVAERTVLLPKLERLVRALEKVTDAKSRALAVRGAARVAARSDALPRDDVRSTAEYRRFALERILARALIEIVNAP